MTTHPRTSAARGTLHTMGLPAAEELPVPPARGNFHSRYLLTGEARPRYRRGVRLLDCMLCVRHEGEVGFFDEAVNSEFLVIDTVRIEKAWFEWSHGSTAKDICAMIESTFAAQASRVGERTWIV